LKIKTLAAAALDGGIAVGNAGSILLLLAVVLAAR